MPGIFGVFRKNGDSIDANRQLIEAMEKVQLHHDFYATEHHADQWGGIGNIDIPLKGEQRFLVDKNSGIAAAFSGYIYGWKNMDAELCRDTHDKAGRLIEIYKTYGDKIADKIDGSFNAVIYDPTKKNVLIFNDRFGHRQLYYYENDELFLFAGEIKAILACDKFDKRIDNKAVADFFNYTYPIGDKTFFEGVKILRGGHTITIAGGTVTINKYWDYKYSDESDLPIEGLVDQADSLYEKIIKKRLSFGDKILIPLSGGLDSRFLTAHTIRAGYEPHCFSHGTAKCGEAKIASQVASKLGLKHYSFINIDPSWLVDYAQKFVYLTEGMVDASSCPLLGIGAQYQLPPERTVFLNGIFGGPTNFGGGYFRQEDIVENLDYDEKLNRIRRTLFGQYVDDSYYALFTPELRTDFKERYFRSIDEEFKPCLKVSHLFCNQKDIFFIKNRLFRFMNLVDCNRFGWHDHFALADDALVDFYIKLPPSMKLGRKFFIEYFKIKFPELAGITYLSRGTNLFRQPSPYRKKIKQYVKQAKYYAERFSRGRLIFYDRDSYMPQDQWFRAHKKISSYYQEILLDDETIRRGYYNKAAVQELIDREKQGGNSFRILSGLLAFELFHRLFIDK